MSPRVVWATASLWALSCAAVDAADGPAPCQPLAGVLCTVAGSARAGQAGDGGPATSAELWAPVEVYVPADGTLYIAEWGNNRVRVVAPGDGTITTLAGNGTFGVTQLIAPLDANLAHPAVLEGDGAGALLIGALHGHAVVRLETGAESLEAWLGTGASGQAVDGAPVATAPLNQPSSVRWLREGGAFVMDAGNLQVRRVTPDGSLALVAGVCRVEKVDGTWPCADGEVPTACPDTPRSYCGTAAPEVACAGACVPLSAGDDGPLREARFACARGIDADPGCRLAVAPGGEALYLAETKADRIRRLDLAADRVTTALGAGQGDPEVALRAPSDAEVGPDGALYVADTGNSCVRRFANGVTSTVAGRCGAGGLPRPGVPAPDSPLNRPYGIAFSPQGDLYIADTANNRIHRVVGVAPPP